MSVPESWEEQWASLTRKLEQDEPVSYQEFEELWKGLQRRRRDLQKYLEYAVERQDQVEEKRKLEQLLRKIIHANLSERIQGLYQLGCQHARKEALQGALAKQGFRLLELVRSGNRTEVYYRLLRAFYACEEPFPKQLVEPFQPCYENSHFAAMMLSYLSGVLQTASGFSSSSTKGAESAAK